MWKKKIVSWFNKNFPEKSKNLKQKRAMRVLHLLYFLSGSRFPKLFSKVAVLKFRTVLWKTPAWISVLVVGHSLHIYRNWIAQHFVLGILKKLFIGISWINCCMQKQLLEVFCKESCFKKFLRYSQKNMRWRPSVWGPATLLKRNFNRAALCKHREIFKNNSSLWFFQICHKPRFSWKFHWKSSSRSEDTKTFPFNVNYFHLFFGIFDISLLQRN